jgi:guanylate kinase
MAIDTPDRSAEVGKIVGMNGQANLELKVHCSDPDRVIATVRREGARLARDHDERDTYFKTPSLRLKYREGSAHNSSLIAYDRADEQNARVSRYEIANLEDDADKLILTALTASPGVDVVVEKHRTTFTAPDWLVNVDRLLGHVFVEIEVFASPDAAGAADTMARLSGALGIRKVDIIPQSYSQVVRQVERADRERLLLGDRLGDLFLIDGPSGAGKSSLVHALRRTLPDECRFLRRVTSRARRPGDEAVDEYDHVTPPQFQQMVRDGDFIESKDFLFDMSYGIAWSQVRSALNDPGTRVAFGVMNLGNIRHVKEFTPEVRRVLVSAPIDQLRARLAARGTHTAEALDERLDNARMANESEDLYDTVIWNEDGAFEASLSRLVSTLQNSQTTAPRAMDLV